MIDETLDTELAAYIMDIIVYIIGDAPSDCIRMYLAKPSQMILVKLFAHCLINTLDQWMICKCILHRILRFMAADRHNWYE